VKRASFWSYLDDAGNCRRCDAEGRAMPIASPRRESMIGLALAARSRLINHARAWHRDLVAPIEAGLEFAR
jgi:hypothetical protein